MGKNKIYLEDNQQIQIFKMWPPLSISKAIGSSKNLMQLKA